MADDVVLGNQVARWWSVSSLAGELGIDRVVLARRLAEAGLRARPGPKGAKLYRLGDVVEAFATYRQIETGGTDYEEAKRRKTLAEAMLAEIDLAQKAGRLVPVEIVGELVGAEYANVRSRLLAIPSKLAAAVLACARPAEAERVIADGIHDALRELVADADLGGPGDGPGDPGGSAAPGARAASAPAAKADGQRVGRRKAPAEPGVERGARKVANRPGRVPARDDGRAGRSRRRARRADDREPGG